MPIYMGDSEFQQDDPARRAYGGGAKSPDAKVHDVGREQSRLHFEATSAVASAPLLRGGSSGNRIVLAPNNVAPTGGQAVRFGVYPVAVVLFTVAYAMASLAFGWWTVFVVGAVWASIVRASDRPARLAAAGAAVGFVGLLALTGADGPVGQLAGVFGTVLPLPLTLLYIPAVIGGGALSAGGALLVCAMRAREDWGGDDRRMSVAGEPNEA